MRVEHIPVRRRVSVKMPKEFLSELPQNVAVFTTAQYMHVLEDILTQVEQAGKTPVLYQARHTHEPGQILGCSTQSWPDVDGFLYVGEGEFHPKALALANTQTIYQYEPLLEKAHIFSSEEIARIQKQHKGAVTAFLYANVCGLLLTTKSGQKDMQALDKLREKYPKKTFIPFLVNTIDWQGLEDFPFVEVWINTGCPRIGLDDQNKVRKPLLNAEHLLESHSF